MSDQITGW